MGVGCIDVGVGKPCVERERRQLDDEADEEEDEHPGLDGSAVIARPGRDGRQLHDVERVAREGHGLPGGS